MSRRPSPQSPAELIAFGWEIAEATLAEAATELTLVTHWFLTPEDAGVNRDEHFGSDERTLRFLTVALPTLVVELGAKLAVVAFPWGLETDSPTLTVIGVGRSEPAEVQTRPLTPVTGQPGAPFWRLGPGRVTSPRELVVAASGFSRLE